MHLAAWSQNMNMWKVLQDISSVLTAIKKKTTRKHHAHSFAFLKGQLFIRALQFSCSTVLRAWLCTLAWKVIFFQMAYLRLDGTFCWPWSPWMTVKNNFIFHNCRSHTHISLYYTHTPSLFIVTPAPHGSCPLHHKETFKSTSGFRSYVCHTAEPMNESHL